MLIRYEHSTLTGEKNISQSSVGDFIRSNFKEDYSDRGDRRSDMQVKLDGSCEVLLKLVEMLLKKGLLTLQDIADLVPHKNYIRLISLDEERDWDLNK